MHRKPPKPRKCSICKIKPGIYQSGLKVWCGDPECGTTLSLALLAKQRANEAKAIKKDLRKRKQKLNDTVPIWTKKAQDAFNVYIRERDFDLPCISCGKTEVTSSGYRGACGWDAGHYRSVGANPELRFEVLNCHKQCSRPCNKDLSGNSVNYRRGLIDKIGIEKVEWIEGPHEKKYYRVEELKEIAAHYRKLTRELKKQREI